MNYLQINYQEFKSFFIENDIKYPILHFSGYYFSLFIKNKMVGVISYSKDYSIIGVNWNNCNIINPLKIVDISLLENYTQYKIDLINYSIDYINNNFDTNIISSLVKIDDYENNELYSNLKWNNIGYVKGNYLKKNSKFRYIKYLKNIEDFKYKLSFLCYPYTSNIIGIIYKITNTINNKIYIGQTVRGALTRYNEHKKSIYNINKKDNHLIIEGYKKYGFENFKFEIIDHAESFEELNKKEIYYISYYDSLNNGYNLNEGGRNSFATEETKRKMSISKKGKPKDQNWIKKVISAAGTEEAKKYGRPKTDEDKRHLSENSPKYWLGKKRDEETKNKVSQTKKAKGLKPPNTKKMVMIDSDGKLVKIYESAKDCAFHSGYSYDRIYDRLRGKYKNNLEHKFYYLEDYNGEYDLETDLYIKPKEHAAR